MAARAYNAVFTAETLEPRTSAKGRPYLHARGILRNSTGPVTRTVLVRGPGYDDVLAKLRIGEPLALRGFYERVRNGSGRGGQFFSAFGLANHRKSTAGVRTPSGTETTPDSVEDADAGTTETHEALHGVRDHGPSVPAGPVTTRRSNRRTARRPTVRTDASRREAIVPTGERPPMPSVEEMEARALEQQARRQPELIREDPVDDLDDDAPIRSVGGHVREPYWRRQRHGPGRSLVRMVYIGRSIVNGGPGTGDETDVEKPEGEMLLL